MSVESPPAAPTRAMQCMEIVGGNVSRREYVRGAGLDIWVDSRPLGGQAGGDVHYFTMCGGGHVTRLALADVSGHGASVSQAARRLRNLLRKNMNTLDQTRLAMALNEGFAEGDDGRFATALLMTYFAPTRHLILCNAGHPRPLWYRREAGQWVWLESAAAADGAASLRSSDGRYHLRRISNLPLGILAPLDYEQFAIRPEPGDLLIAYTDAVTEATNPAGEMLGEPGLLAMVERLGPSPPDDFGPRFSDALDTYRGGAASGDDQTLVVIESTNGGVPPMTTRQAVKSLLKMAGVWRV